MRTRRLLVVAALVLAGCSGQGGKAERDYEFVKKNGSALEICDAAKKVAEGYRADRNDREYQSWSITSFNDCHTAGLVGDNPFPVR